MSTRNCAFPWHWALIANDGSVHPCSHGSGPIGNLRENTIEEIWNGQLMQEVRSCILKGETHALCQSSDCPFQRSHPAFAERKQAYQIDETFAADFDEDWYLDTYPGVRQLMADYGLVSGLEHYIRHGREEAKQFRLKSAALPEKKSFLQKLGALFSAKRSKAPKAQTFPPHNAILGLMEYSRGLTIISARPVDITVAITTLCNLRCAMCPHGMSLVVNPSHMPVEVLERAESFLNVASRMLLAGVGEPSLAPSFWWLVEKVKSRKDLFIRANTNAYSMTREKADKIMDSGITELSISLDATTPESYLKIRGADFEKVLKGTRALVEARAASGNKRLSLNINMTLMRENLPEAADFVSLGKALGVDAIVFTQLFSFGDRPDWRVERDHYTFVYSDQMIGKRPEAVRTELLKVKQLASELQIPVFFRDNVESYLR